MTHALLLRSTPMRPLHPLVLAASLLLKRYRKTLA